MAHEGWMDETSFLRTHGFSLKLMSETKFPGHGRSEEDDGGVGPGWLVGWFWHSIKWAFKRLGMCRNVATCETEVGRYGDYFVFFLEMAILWELFRLVRARLLEGVWGKGLRSIFWKRGFE